MDDKARFARAGCQACAHVAMDLAELRRARARRNELDLDVGHDLARALALGHSR